MTLTTSPSTRPRWPSRTTSSDLCSAHCHRGRCGPLPVWTGPFAVEWPLVITALDGE
jgi:hypothetical protein